MVAENASLAAIVVAYNDASRLARTLGSLRNGTLVPDRVIVVDNSTHDDVRISLEGDDDVVYIPAPTNLGFCEANNVGIRKAMEFGADQILLLNHDTLLDPDCLAAMTRRAHLEGPGVLVAPKIRLLAEPQRLWYAGGHFNRLIGAGVNRGFGMIDNGQFDAAQEVTYATGCCLLVPAEVFVRIGFLNADMFMYLDDIEFCLRARTAGYGIHYEPAAILYHELGSGSNLRLRPDYYLYFSIRNKPRVVSAFGAYKLYLYALAALFGCIKLLQFAFYPGIGRRTKKIRALFWGIVDAFSGGARYRRRFPELFARPARDAAGPALDFF